MVCASSAPPVTGPATTSACVERSTPAARRADPARSARSSRDGGTAGAGSDRRGRGSRCRSRSARSASALRAAAGPVSAFSRISSRRFIACFSPRLASVDEHRAAADDRRRDAAAQLPAVERRVLRPRPQPRARRCAPADPGARMVMSAGAPSDSVPPGTLQDPRRVDRHQLDQPRQPDQAGVHQPIEATAAPPSRGRRCRTARGRTRPSSRRSGAARGRWR